MAAQGHDHRHGRGGGDRHEGERREAGLRARGAAEQRGRHHGDGSGGEGHQGGDVEADACQPEGVGGGGHGGGDGQGERESTPVSADPAAGRGGGHRGEEEPQGEAADQVAQRIGLTPADRPFRSARQPLQLLAKGPVRVERRGAVSEKDEESAGRLALEPHSHGRRLPALPDRREGAERHGRRSQRNRHRLDPLPRRHGHGPVPAAEADPSQLRRAQRPLHLGADRVGVPAGIERGAAHLHPDLLLERAVDRDGLDARDRPQLLGGEVRLAVRSRDPDDREEISVLVRGRRDPQPAGEAPPEVRELRLQPRRLALRIGPRDEADGQRGAVRAHLAGHLLDAAERADGALDLLDPGARDLGGIGSLVEGERDRQLREALPRQVLNRQPRQGHGAQDEQAQGEHQAGERPAVPHRALSVRITHRYRTGTSRSDANVEVIMPPMTQMASARCSSTPSPGRSASGSMPATVVAVVIRMGR